MRDDIVNIKKRSLGLDPGDVTGYILQQRMSLINAYQHQKVENVLQKNSIRVLPVVI